MEITINDKVYLYRYKIDEITLMDYLDVADILNEDQYDTYVDQHSKEVVNRKEPRPKTERDDEFIINLYRKIVKLLSNLPLKYTKDDEVIKELIGYLEPVFNEVNNINTSFDIDDENEFPIFTLNDTKLKVQPLNEWCFYKWVTLEILMSKGSQEKGEDGKIIQLIKGNRFILPLFYGEWEESMKDFDDKFNLFNKQRSFTTTYPIYIRILYIINQVKKKHNFIYNAEGGQRTSSVNMLKHNEDFGWLGTLTNLSEKGVFGTYKEVKQSSLFDVLEYLNCSISKDTAEAEDMKLQNKQ